MNKLFTSLSDRARQALAVLTVLLMGLPPGFAGSGSVWKEDAPRSMFADKRGRAAGDIVTILVQENNTATKDNSTKTSKTSSVDASLSTFLYGPAVSKLLAKGGQMPAMKFGGTQTFDGGGKINNSENITARIAVQIMETLPNGNLLIEGRRETSFAGEKQQAILRGVIRGDDILANNTVYSYNVANATIQLVSRGTISDNQRKGWLMKVWEKVTPF